MSPILAIDPGPTTSGWVLYDNGIYPQVIECGQEADLDTVFRILGRCLSERGVEVVAIERVQSYGISGASLLETSEVVGRLWQRALDVGFSVRLVRRLQVLSALNVTGKGNKDSLVRHRLMEIHGGSGSVGTKKAPGPLYGVSGHAWSALAVAWTASRMMS